MHSPLRTGFFLWLLCLPFSLLSQNVSITYTNPPDFTVCDTVVFEVTIANTLSDTLFSLNLSAEMPLGVGYVAGSVTNAVQGNISNLNAPLFNLANLPPGESITVTYLAQTECVLVAAINNGDLFSNVYTANYMGGTKSATTTPYVIKTALLQIVSLNDQMMSGTTGDILTRTWTLTNTRLGALSSLTFTDIYANGIFITSPMGTVVTQAQGILELELTSADFMNFGDGDGFFELNEQIVITEMIEITGCGTPPQSTSFLSASWGCHGVACQEVSTTAVVAISGNGQEPNIVSAIFDPLPLDYCAAASNMQGILLTNTGGAPANDLAVYISHFDKGSMGLQQGMISITNNGNQVDAEVGYFNPVSFESCATPLGVFDSIAIVISTLLPGDTILIQWEAFVCAVDCNANPPAWRFDFYHENDCPVGSFGSGGAVSQPFGSADLMSQFTTFYIGQFLEHGGTYTLTYTLKSFLLVDSVGVLQIDIDLPCGVGWGNNDDFNLNGHSPFNVIVTPGTGGSDDVSLFFDLPFGVDSVGSDFNITFECSAECFDIPDCIVEYVSSCPKPPATGVIDDLEVNVNSTILLNNVACGPQVCEEFPLTYYCEASTDEICPDTILGYFISEMDFHRENLGLPDNNNDRFADNTGTVDLNLIRRDRAVPGDTLHTIVNGVMNIDVPGSSIPNALLVVNFESHLLDNGWDGGIFMDTVNHRPLVFDGSGFINLGGTVKITDASTGEVYECNLPIPNTIGGQRGEIYVVNTRPVDIFDIWYYLTYTYNITPEFLASQGCDIPDGWAFEQGDAIEANIFHRPVYNASPAVVINMRTVSGLFAANLPGPLQQKYFNCGADFTRWQLSSYSYRISPGLYELPPCTSSNVPGAAFMEFILAKPNFFPYEFRSFANLTKWEYILPTTATLLDSRIDFLTIQGGLTIMDDEPLAWVQSGQVYEFDISDIPLGTLDEGYHLRFKHEFELDCQVLKPQPVSVHAVIDFSPMLFETDPLDTTVYGPITLFPIRPNMALTPINVHYQSTSNTAVWEFELGNDNTQNQTAPNAWFSAYSPSGQITDFQLINLTTGQTIPLGNGIFQLGELPNNWMNEFQLTANINTCEPDIVEVNFGWNCDPYTDLMQEACQQETTVLTLSALLGEIEMDVQSPISPFQLCDTIGYHTIEIFNAQFGAVYDIELRAALPSGLNIIPGTSQMAFPSGTAFQTIADPVLVNGDTALYDLSSLNATLADQGLLGFNQTPNHSVTIRFQAATECGFVSPTQIIFNATGTQGCGSESNNLSKPGAELFIEGVTPLYDANITIGTNGPPTLSCGDNIQIDVTLEADAVTAATDSVFVLVPAGLAYQPGSYLPGMNASPNAPIIDFSNSQFVLKWPLVGGLQPFTTISFSMIFSAVAGGECDSTVLEIVTYQLQEAECVATGDLCSTLAETGSINLPVIFAIPSLGLDDFTFSVENFIANYTLLLENNGNATSDTILVEIYNDLDGSGTFTPGDILIETYTHIGGLGSGEIVTIAGSFLPFHSLLCSVIAVVNSQNNCTCTEDIAFGPSLVPYLVPLDSTCLGNELTMGFEFPPSNTFVYQWSPVQGLSCTDCPNPLLNTNALSLPSLPTTINLHLMQTYPNGCVVDYDFPITIFEGGSETEETLESCPNTLILLQGPDDAASYNWDGPGIIDSTLQNQPIVLTDSATVTLIWSDDFDCPNTVNYFINVPEELVIDTIPLCTGDSVTIDDVVYFDEVETCDTITTSNNCEVIRCQFYEPRDTPMLNFPLDTLCFVEGTEIIIDQLGDGYNTYLWSPSELLSCNDCPFPSLEVANQTFEVTVSDGTDCRATTQVTVIAIPPCSGQSIEMPNVFTPNGDGTNDLFGPVMMPGIEKLVTTAKLRIWDRWGTKVYEGEGINNVRWDGLHKGKAAASEVYIFMLEMACEEDVVVVKGDVTLLR